MKAVTRPAAGGSTSLSGAHGVACDSRRGLVHALSLQLASGDITVETREIAITLTANLTNDTFVRLTQAQNVRVRNDLVRVR